MTSAPPLGIQSLSIEQVSYAYGRTPALQNVSATLRAGELVAIVGPNGCGKSTLLRTLVGELRPSSGRILLDEEPLSGIERRQAARRMALVPQMTSSAFAYTVREMVLMARFAAHGQGGMLSSALGFETAEDVQLSYEAMWSADVHHLADRPVDALSGGERQRVSIARAFTQHTPVLLLDEPTAALDLFHQLELWAQLQNMVKRQNRLVAVVLHDLNTALAQATRVLVMDRGQVVADGAPKDVLTPEILEPVYRVGIHRVENALCFSRLGAPVGG